MNCHLRGKILSVQLLRKPCVLHLPFASLSECFYAFLCILCGLCDLCGEESFMPIEAVIFDMDGVIVDSEEYWWQSRVEFAQKRGLVWTFDDQRVAMGRST